MASPEPSSAAAPSRRQIVLICLVLLASVLAVYGRTYRRDFTFINLDDNDYVTANPHVQEGTTLDSLKWAMTAFHSYNWHPLTWMSLELDYQLYGLSSAGFHFTNVLLHAANTVLLFWLLQRLTRAVWCSAAVAAFFGVHPVHVESVAWVTERKDVLSTLFWLLTMAAYTWYAARPGLGRYLLVALGLGLGLMAKPMVVTLPAVLLLWDVWPLRRWPHDKAAATPFAPASGRRLLLEKLPLFLIVAATIPLTLKAQEEMINTQDQLPIPIRIANSLVAYVKYIGILLWPSNLAVYYPHPREAIPHWQPVMAALLLAGLTAATCWSRRRRPYLAVGWLWYLGTMVPVIGVVQVGMHELADRYTYVPSIGLSIFLFWGIAEVAARWHVPRPALASLAGCVLVVCLVLTWRQIGYWKDSETLWKHALAVTRESAMGHVKFAEAVMYQKSKLGEARKHLRRSLELDSTLPWTHSNLAFVLEEQGEWEEAAKQYKLAMQLACDPSLAWSPSIAQETKEHSLCGLGRLRELRGQFREAQKCYAAVLEFNPSHIEARIGLAGALEEQGLLAEAQQQYEDALRQKPKSSVLYDHLGRVLQRQQRFVEALEYFDRALQLQPGSAEVWNNKGVALEQLGRLEEAEECYRRAVERDYEQPLFHCNLAYALAESGHKSEAREEYLAAFRLNPRWPQATLQQAWNLATRSDLQKRNGRQALRTAKQVCQATNYEAPQALEVLAAAYAELGQFEEAVKWQRKALSLLPAELPTDIRKGVQERLHLYEKHEPYRQPPAPSRPNS